MDKYVVGNIVDAGGYIQLPVNTSEIIDKCLTDPKYFKAHMNANCEEPMSNTYIINSLYRFIAGTKAQIFKAHIKEAYDPNDPDNEILMIRINPKICIFVRKDLTAFLGEGSEYNSFVFKDTMEYSSKDCTEYFVEKPDLFRGTLKDFFEMYASDYNISIGDLFMDSL